ncbi:MAG: HD domain-containing protein [Acidilobus sp.]
MLGRDAFDEDRLGAFEQKGVIQDSIHGFIPINRAEYWLLQTPFLRRLHGIKQLGMAFLVFPSARHSRLEHSLGVMHLATLIAMRVVQVARRDPKVRDAIFQTDKPSAVNSFVQVARLTGLLHDLGHLAYSHMTEEAVTSLAMYSEEGKGSAELFKELSGLGHGKIKVHEAYTQAFIDGLVKLASEAPAEAAVDTIQPFLTLVKSTLAKDLEGRQDTPRSALEELGLREGALSVIRDIISNEIADADRLDYLQRDAQATGIVYGNIDADRLVSGITVNVINDEPVLSLDIKSLQTLEDVFDARYKMYRSVYFHHKVIALTKAVTYFMRSLAFEWRSDAIPLYEGLSLYEVLSPSRLTNAILEDRYYFDDAELDNVVRFYAARGKLSRRWALSLLDRRDLLPISIVKRSEELIIMAEDVLRSANVPVNPDNVSKLLVYAVSRLNQINDKVKKRLSVDVKLDDFKENVINPQKLYSGGLRVFGWEQSLYLRSLAEEGKIPVVLLYAYADDDKVHVDWVRKRAEELRELTKAELRDVMMEGLDELR